MRLGVHVVSFNIDGGPTAIGPTLARVGEAAERAGVANLSAMDHYLQRRSLRHPAGAGRAFGSLIPALKSAKNRCTPTSLPPVPSS